MSRVAAHLGVSWHTANDAVLNEGRRMLIDDPARFDGVKIIGVDEHVWRHTRFGDKYVTVIIDLTPVRNKTGPARLLDMGSSPVKWMLLLLSSGLAGAELVERVVCLVFEFGVAAGPDFESA